MSVMYHVSSTGPSRPPTTEEVREALIRVLGHTGYDLEQVNGQRKLYHPLWKSLNAAPTEGCEVFVGRLPRDLYEDELVPPFLSIGPIYELRTMMNFSGTNRGFAFVSYFDKNTALQAIKKLNNFEIRKGKFIGVLMSLQNRKLFITGLNNIENLREKLFMYLQLNTAGVQDVCICNKFGNSPCYRSARVIYYTHHDAAMARRQLIPIKNQVFGSNVKIDWDDPRLEAKGKMYNNLY